MGVHQTSESESGVFKKSDGTVTDRYPEESIQRKADPDETSKFIVIAECIDEGDKRSNYWVVRTEIEAINMATRLYLQEDHPAFLLDGLIHDVSVVEAPVTELESILGQKVDFSSLSQV